MVTTFKEAQEQLYARRYELAVWSDIVSYLSTMMTFETHQAEKMIKTEDGLLSVPEEVIDGVMNLITEEKINPLNEQIESFSQLSVTDLTTEETSEDEPDTEEGGQGEVEEDQKQGGQARQVPKRVGKAVRRS